MLTEKTHNNALQETFHSLRSLKAPERKRCVNKQSTKMALID